MSRALVRTWLPLDKWREYFGINPLHFHQAYSEKFTANCGDVWFQYSWQKPAQVGRHELAIAIHDHGWANLQSMHLNLPFADDAEFARLHAAIRRVLPILPALAASSPFQEGRFSGYLDTRLEHYRGHQIRVRETIGSVIPDATAGIADYRARVLEKIYAAIAPFDPGDILRHEWLNARGVIPRFERNALEIRVIDMQECPQADLAIAAAASAVVRALDEGKRDLSLDTERLTGVFIRCIQDGERALVG